MTQPPAASKSSCSECHRTLPASERSERDERCGICLLREQTRTLRERAAQARAALEALEAATTDEAAAGREVDRLASRLLRPPTPGARLADAVARVGGSWAFVGGFLVAIVVWMALNAGAAAVDPYPFILLNLILSCVAAIQAPIILMSQNRSSEHDRAQAHEDFRVNVQAERSVALLQAKLDVLLKNRWDELEMEETQSVLLEEVLDRLDGPPP